MSIQEAFRADMDAALQDRARLVAELRAALQGHQAHWGEFEETWSARLYGPGRELHTVIDVHLVNRRTGPAPGHPRGRPCVLIDIVKRDHVGRICDHRAVETAAEALAWIEQPRSDETVSARQSKEEHRRYAERDKVDLAGLAGRQIETGLNGSDQVYRIIEFDGIGRVRITTLGDRRWRIALARRTRTVAVPEGRDAAETVRTAIEDLHAEVPDAR